MLALAFWTERSRPRWHRHCDMSGQGSDTGDPGPVREGATMERSFGTIKVAAIVAVVIAGALGTEGGALQAVGTRVGAAPATSRTALLPEAPVAAPGRFSAETRRRAEVERAWHEAVQQRCGVASGSVVLPPQSPAC